MTKKVVVFGFYIALCGFVTSYGMNFSYYEQTRSPEGNKKKKRESIQLPEKYEVIDTGKKGKEKIALVMQRSPFVGHREFYIFNITRNKCEYVFPKKITKNTINFNVKKSDFYTVAYACKKESFYDGSTDSFFTKGHVIIVDNVGKTKTIAVSDCDCRLVQWNNHKDCKECLAVADEKHNVFVIKKGSVFKLDAKIKSQVNYFAWCPWNKDVLAIGCSDGDVFVFDTCTNRQVTLLCDIEFGAIKKLQWILSNKGKFLGVIDTNNLGIVYKVT